MDLYLLIIIVSIVIWDIGWEILFVKFLNKESVCEDLFFVYIVYIRGDKFGLFWIL